MTIENADCASPAVKVLFKSTSPSLMQGGSVGTGVGVGVGVQLSKNISLRAEAEHFDDIDVNLVSVGVVFNTH